MKKTIVSILTILMCLTSFPIMAEEGDTHSHTHEHETTQETTDVTQNTENNQETNEESHTNEDVSVNIDDGTLVVEEVHSQVEEPIYYCNKEEHVHSEECFDKYRVLICEDISEKHIHTEECFQEYSFLICEKQEHIHDENCLDENYEEPIIEVDEFALEQQKQFEELLNKALNEEDGYFLNCEKTEHTHTPECFEYREDLICEKEEILDEENENYHIHTDECYEKYYIIICKEKEEHTHTMDCISHQIETGEIEDVVIEVPSEIFDAEIDHSDIPADETIEEETPIRQLMRAPRLLGSATGVNIREFVVQQFYGGTMQSGKYTWNANYNTSGHRFSFRLNYALGGVGELDANSVVFTVPKQILRDRNNNFAGTYEMSIPSKRDVDSGEELDADISFAYYEDGDNIKIYNFKEISAGSNGYIELSYLTNKTASNYKDMGKSDDFVARMDVTNNEQTISSTSGTYNVYINTNSKISSVVKGPSGYPSRYSSWQSSWGTAPANADDYYYLVWTIRTTVAEPVTQPYNFTLQDTLQTANGEVVGYKFSGQSTYSASNTVTNQTNEGYRYDYVLTRHPKSYWQPLEHWSIKNSVTAIVDPVDQIDADTKSSASQTYVWNKPVFTIPTGHFNSYKRADGNWRACDLQRQNGSYYCTLTYLTDLGNKAGEYSRYDLDEFQDGTITELGNLDYAVWMRGYPYPWTYQANSSLGQKDPNNYGILKVKFELIDEGVYLWDEADSLNENLPLDYNDFEIDTIAYNIKNSHVTGFDEEYQRYIIESNVFDNDDILNFYGKFANGDWVLIATYKPLDKTTWFDSNYVESMTNSLITLKDNCVAYKVDTTNSHYYTEVNTVPNMHLKNSTKVMNFVQGKQSIGIYNKQTANFYKQDGTKILTTNEADSNFARVTQKDSYIFKDSVAATNNVKKKYYVISWKVGMTEQYIAGEGDINYINQSSGVFYDLLPEGAVLDVNSVSVRAGTSSRYSNAVDTAEKMKNRTGQFLPTTAYTVEQIPDYKGTGRTLLIVRIKEEAKYYDVFFDTIHSWDSISDWGNDVYNPVAYETGNDKIKYGTNNDGGQISEKQLMANLPSEAEGEKFIYAEAEFDIATITAASTGLTKKVKALDDKDFSYDTITTNDGDYEYRWRIASSHTSKTKNIILFDSMENYVVEGKASDWRGTIQSIDLSHPKSMGINPVLYYSTTENLDIETNHDITDSSVWQRLTDQTDLSTVKALAADLRKTTSGADFVLNEGESLSIILHMKAPHGAESQGTYPEAYNNIYLSDTVIGLNGQPQDFFIHQDYTTVRFIITEDLTLKKVSSEDNATPLKDLKFRLRGTSDYGTEEDRIIATDNTGTIVFKDIEKGSYILSEYESTKDWLLNPAEFTVTVDAEGVLSITGQENSNFLDFTYNNGIYTLTVKDDPRVHGDVTLLKRREGDSADDVEIKQELANAEIGDTITYKGVNCKVMDKTSNKVLIEGIENVLLIEDTYMDDVYRSRKTSREYYEALLPILDNSWSYNDEDDKLYSESNIYQLYGIIDNGEAIPLALTGFGVTPPKYNWFIGLDRTDDNIFLLGDDWSMNYDIDDEPFSSDSGMPTFGNTWQICYSIKPIWIDYTFKPQTSIPDTTFKLSGTSDYGTETTRLETTNTAGRVTFTDIELGTYTLEEIVPNSNYILNTTKWTVKVDEQGNVSIIEPEDETLRDRLYTVEQVGNNYVVFNEPRYWDFTLRKIDKENETIWLEGAEFTLTGISDLGTEYNEVVESNENGRVLFERIEKGTYILKETKAPQGVTETGAQGGNRNYIADGKDYIVKIDNQGNVTIDGLSMNQYDDYVVKNDRAYDGKITIIKKWEDNSNNDSRPEPVVHLSTTEPTWRRGITVTKVWEGDSAEDRPEDIKAHLVEKDYVMPDVKICQDTSCSPYVSGQISYEIVGENNLTFRLISEHDSGRPVAYVIISVITDGEGNERLYRAISIDFYDDATNRGEGKHLVIRIDDKENSEILTDTYAYWYSSPDGDYNPETDGSMTQQMKNAVDKIYLIPEIYNLNLNSTAEEIFECVKEIFYITDNEFPEWEKDFSKKYIDLDISRTNGWTKNQDNTWTYTFDILLEDENADKEFYVWEEPVDGYTTENDESNPVLVENQAATITNTIKPWSAKYAVSLMGIGVDENQNGETMGLTFGPATGNDANKTWTKDGATDEGYVNAYKSHTPTGNTANGNAHRCLHDDDWETIIEWNNIDPYVYEQCINENCTHSVELHEAGETILNPQFKGVSTGDGPSQLWYELIQYNGTAKVEENLRWHPNNNRPNDTTRGGTNYDGWGASRIRAMLNGADSLTDLGDGTATKPGGTDVYSEDSDIHKSASIYTTTNNLLATFPQELQNAIGKRATKYDSVYDDKTEANLKTSYDKLWLLSTNEIWSTSQISSSDAHPLEGTQYARFVNGNSGVSSSGNDSQNVFNKAYKFTSNTGVDGSAGAWWLRSSTTASMAGAVDVWPDGSDGIGYGYYALGVSPCFSLDSDYEFYTTKYAVQIYGIGQDTLQDGSAAGLTFGPALGQDFMNTYISHTPTGTTTLGNAHRCIHDDDWKTIVEWNKVDPAVYEQCIGENCTHSVNLTFPDYLKKTSFVYGGSSSGDGVGTLYDEFNNQWHRSWNPINKNTSYGTNEGGWGASRIRAMMNGYDELTMLKESYNYHNSGINKIPETNYTSGSTLIDAFPQILQDNIGARKTLYDSVYNSKTAANLKTSYDKLWLLSPNEMTNDNATLLYNGSYNYYQHPLESNGGYQKFLQNNQYIKGYRYNGSSNTADYSNDYFKAYGQNGNTATSSDDKPWWLRSSSGDYGYRALYVTTNGSVYYIFARSDSGVSPCFSLKR